MSIESHFMLAYFSVGGTDCIIVNPNKKNKADKDLIKLDVKEIRKKIKSKKITEIEDMNKNPTIQSGGAAKILDAESFVFEATKKNVQAIIDACGGCDFIEYDNRLEKFPTQLMP